MSLSSDPSISSADPLVKPPKSKRGMSRNQKILFFVTGWLIVLMPFLFWWNTWFGRHLSDQQLNEYLHDDKKPRHIQHALVQDRKSTRLNSSHSQISYAVFCLKKNNPQAGCTRLATITTEIISSSRRITTRNPLLPHATSYVCGSYRVL